MSSAPKCNCEEWMRSACLGSPSYEGAGGERYCVLHFPDKNKSVDFEAALEAKRSAKNFDFSGVWFPDDFLGEKFNFTASVSFRKATFNAPATFSEFTFSTEAKADFSQATFKAAVTFRQATFSAKVEFSSTIFEREVSFRTTSFKAKADFSQAEFRSHTDFTRAHFEKDAEPNFFDAKFSAGTNFENAMFEGRTNFDAVTFKGDTNFNYVTFNETVTFLETTFQARVFFEDATFAGEAKFFHTTFEDYVRFKGQVFLQGSRPDFRNVKSAELISFYSLTLRPHWFVDLNASKFSLTNVRWDWRRITIHREIDAIAEKYKSVSPYLLLEMACWNLAVNAEENRRYEEASKFRYMAMEARRQSSLVPEAYWRLRWREVKRALARLICSLKRNREVERKILTKSKLFWTSFCKEFSWKSFLRSFNWKSFKSFWRGFGLLHWLYWLVSGYGEKVVRSAMVLVGICVIFACIYAMAVTDEKHALTRLPRALAYSAGVITLQRPDFLTTTPSTTIRSLAILETTLGPLQLALFLLAIRRKFMR